MMKKGSHEGTKSYGYFEDLPKLKMLWQFELLTRGVNGKIVKCAIS